MKKIIYSYFIICSALAIALIISHSWSFFSSAKIQIRDEKNNENDNVNNDSFAKTEKNNQEQQINDKSNALKDNYLRELEKINLEMPYIHESPDKSWTGPWKNGCEEASIAMVEYYYLKEKNISIKESMDYMTMLFEKQNQIWGSNADSDASRTARIINDYTNYNATVITNPEIEQIKAELRQKRPVISLHYGKELKNPNIPFLATGSYYHMMVITGYDDTTKEFITHDTGDIKTGANHRYNYDILMNSLSDFDHQTKRTGGDPSVIFTYPKFAKSAESNELYYLNNNVKKIIPDEKMFSLKNWDIRAITIVSEEWLKTIETAEDILIN